jgi:CRP-like cAMP-binding protein
MANGEVAMSDGAHPNGSVFGALATSQTDDADHLLVRRLEQLDPLTSEERQALIDAVAMEKAFPRGSEIVKQGSEPTVSCFLLEGFAGRQTFISDGREQITAIHIPGDFVDLHSFLLAGMDHSIVALSDCRVGMVPHTKLKAITDDHPHLTRVLWLTTLIDGSIHRSWVTAMGRRTAEQHLAHLACELYVRLSRAGFAEGNAFTLPLTQGDMANALGLSSVHVNRVTMELRRKGLIRWRQRVMEVPDFDKLAEFAEFDPTYLNLEGKRLR